MYTQQFNIIAKTLMVLDAAIILISGYTAYYLSIIYRPENTLIMSSYYVLISIMCIMFLNNYLMGSFWLYGEKRFTSFRALLQAIITATGLEFTGFFGSAFFIGKPHVDRIFVLLFFILIFTAMFLVRLFLYFYISNHSHKRLYSYNILIAGSARRIKKYRRCLKTAA